MKGLLFIVSGPSGAGKDTVVDSLRARMPRLRYSVSATTRAPRDGEREGEAYFFLDRDDFAAKLASGALPRNEHLQRKPLRHTARIHRKHPRRTVTTSS